MMSNSAIIILCCLVSGSVGMLLGCIIAGRKDEPSPQNRRDGNELQTHENMAFDIPDGTIIENGNCIDYPHIKNFIFKDRGLFINEFHP